MLGKLAFVAAAAAMVAEARAMPAKPTTNLFNGVARRVDGAKPEQLTQRPSLLPYNAMPNPGAVVVDPSGMARFTVLTDRIIRMESIYNNSIGHFEDRATIAILNRNLPVPVFSQSTTGGVLTITTKSVQLKYTSGQPFAPSTLSVTSLDPTSAFKSWAFGQADTGNLLGTIRGLDEQGQVRKNLVPHPCSTYVVAPRANSRDNSHG